MQQRGSRPGHLRMCTVQVLADLLSLPGGSSDVCLTVFFLPGAGFFGVVICSNELEMPVTSAWDWSAQLSEGR